MIVGIGAPKGCDFLTGCDSYAVVAEELPSGRIRWQERNNSPEILGTTQHVILARFVSEDGLDTSIVAMRARDGKRLWARALPAEICGFTERQLMVSIHNQLAVINMRTGLQISYTDTTSECPDIRLGGIEVTDANVAGGWVVKQALLP